MWSRIPVSNCLYIVAWYRRLKVIVRWNGEVNGIFPVTVGTRQSIILSPKLFNIFLNDLLLRLSESDCVLNTGKDTHNCFAYADDITLFDQTVPQNMLDIYHDYSTRWQFAY